jgi:multidrug efflux pump subunit AcrA (membrane-fusion protein)
MKPEDVLTKDSEHSKDDLPELPQAAAVRGRSGRRLLWFLLIPAVLATSAFFGARARQRTNEELRTTTTSLEVQTVRVIHPQRGASTSDLTLPGMIQAFSQSPVYARVDGYVRTWYVDIGTHVTKGQLLAEIDAPEVDQQLNQARALLSQAETGAPLSGVDQNQFRIAAGGRPE